MARFKVGDKARIVGVHNILGDMFVGQECVILAVGDFMGMTRSQVYRYRIEVRGNVMVANDDELEPIIRLGSWEEIADSVGWSPGKVTEKAT
jgi:hypothetical protein